MTVVYPNQSYNKVCYKETAMYKLLMITLHTVKKLDNSNSDNSKYKLNLALNLDYTGFRDWSISMDYF